MINSTIPSELSSATPVAPIERATFTQRFFALLIDTIILGVINACINTAGLQNVQLGLNQQAQDWWAGAWGIILVVIPILYYVWAYSTNGQTIGKRALKIKVVSMDGTPLNLSKGIIRTFGYIPSSLFFLGFLYALREENRQSWHDKMAGTYVVPATLTREQFLGTMDPAEARRRRRPWLLRLGILTIVLVLAGSGSVYFSVNRGLAEVRQMGTWPGTDISPQELINLDLSQLGLRQNVVQDARKDENWAEGRYEDGVRVTYGADSQDFVAVYAFRYTERRVARNDYLRLQASAAESQVCGRYTYAYNSSSGVINCRFSNGDEKLIWNDQWIMAIMASDGTEYTADVLVDQVQDALALHWMTMGSK